MVQCGFGDRRFPVRLLKDLICLFTLAVLPLFGGWLPADTIGAPISNNPDVAIDAHGNAVAIWVFTEGNNSCIKAATRSAGGSWSAPATLSPPHLQALDGSVAMDPNGNAVAVWSISSGLAQTIQAAVLPCGSKEWMDLDKPALPSENIVTPPKVAFDADGNALVVWGDDEAGYAIQAAWLSRAYKWKSVKEMLVDTVSTLQLAVDPAGNAVILWKGCEDGSNPCIKTATLLREATEWSGQSTLSTADLIASPQVVVDRQGNAVAAWWENRWDKGTMTIRAMKLPNGTNSWQETHFPAVTCFYPRLAMDGTGTAHIMWAAYGPDQPYAFQSSLLKPRELTWAPPETILPATTDYTPYYGLGVDASGNAVAVWANHTAGQFHASLKSVQQRGWSSHKALAPLTGKGGLESWPRLSLSADGSGAVIYSECTDSCDDISWSNAVTAICGNELFE